MYTHGDNRDESSGTALEISLHRYQLRFLETLANQLGNNLSSLCGRLIDASSDHGGGDDLQAMVATGADIARNDPPDTRDSKWTTRVIHLQPSQFDHLCALASSGGHSASAAFRGLLAGFMARCGIQHPGGDPGRRPERGPGRRRPSTPSTVVFHPLVATVAVFVALGVFAYLLLRNESGVEVGPHWGGDNASLVMDPHTHTSYSDGKLSPAQLVELASEEGCDALVISDHSDVDRTVSDEQFEAIEALRASNPDMLLFTGLELNLPSYGGREHIGLIASPQIEREVLPHLRDLGERSLRRASKGGAHAAFDQQLLGEIARMQSLHNGLVMNYNHPSRKDPDANENYNDVIAWNTAAPVLTAFEGSPGHQNARVTGDYREPLLTEDGWDPAVATVGGTWDRLLSEGHQIWGALASSDYHNQRLDHSPCNYSRTHLIVPELSYRGILMALKAGTFWADNGRILNQLWFSIEVDGLEGTLFPGFVAAIDGSPIEAELRVSLERGPGSFGKALAVEFIGSCRSGEPELLAVTEIAPGAAETSVRVPVAAVGLDGESCTIRSRVRLERADGDDLLAYSNHVRIYLR